MFDKLAARIRDSDTAYRLLVPLLLSTLLVQTVTSLTASPSPTARSSSICRSSGSA